MWYHTCNWSSSWKMSSKLVLTKLVHSWMCSLHMVLFRLQVPKRRLAFLGQGSSTRIWVTARVTAFCLLRHPFVLHLKKMQPDFWPFGKRAGEGSDSWQCRDQKPWSSYFGYWYQHDCKGEGLCSALQPALEVCSHGWAVIGFRVADI